MTVANTPRAAGPYLGNGSISVFAFSFKVFLATDVLAQFVSSAGVLTIGTLGTDYAVSLNADQNANPGGSVITTVPLPSGATLTIGSQVPLDQEVVLTNPGGFYPQVISDALDKVTILIQQALQSIAGAIRIPELGSAQILPSAAQRAGQLLSFDSFGNPITVAPVNGTATALAINLANAGDPTKGPAQVGYGPLAYPANTVGGVLTGLTPAKLLVVGNGPWANPAFSDTQHLLEIVNDNSPYQCFAMNAYGVTTNGNNMHWNRYNGTLAAPTVLTNAQYFKSEGYRGWDGSGTLSQSMAAHQVITTENWSPTAHGIKFHWELTKSGGASSRLPAMDLYASLADSVILGLGDGSALFTRIINQSAIGALQLHGDDTQAAAQIILYSRSNATNSFEFAQRALRSIWSTVPAVELMRLTAAGLAINKGADAAYALEVKGFGANLFNLTSSAGDAVAYSITSGTYTSGENAAACAMNFRKASTNRSINAAGTINASGADYAEYMVKAPGCGAVSKGDVIGVNAEGQLTDKWADAITFVVKSTDPSYVGGDTWGSGLDGEELEAARQRVDRIAFSGQVPVNLLGANPGDYIVPEPGDAGCIAAKAVANPTFPEYMASIGRVIAIEADGRARIIVKVA